jgi:hypothetical protein
MSENHPKSNFDDFLTEEGLLCVEAHSFPGVCFFVAF